MCACKCVWKKTIISGWFKQGPSLEWEQQQRDKEEMKEGGKSKASLQVNSCWASQTFNSMGQFRLQPEASSLRATLTANNSRVLIRVTCSACCSHQQGLNVSSQRPSLLTMSDVVMTHANNAIQIFQMNRETHRSTISSA